VHLVWLFIFEILKSLVFCVIKCFESSEEIALYLIMIFDNNYSFTLEIFNLVLDDLVVLHILNASVAFENCVDSLHIWETYRMMIFNVLGDEIRLLIFMILNEETNICDSYSWRSSNRRGTMYVNCVALIINHVVKSNNSL